MQTNPQAHMADLHVAADRTRITPTLDGFVMLVHSEAPNVSVHARMTRHQLILHIGDCIEALKKTEIKPA